MTDVTAIRAEINALAQRRADLILNGGRHVTDPRPCPSHAALLHRIASLITTEELPPARVTVTTAAEVHVDATGTELVESTVRRYAAALGCVVTESAFDVNGWAATQWTAAAYDGMGSFWRVEGYELHPTPVVDRFGVGVAGSC